MKKTSSALCTICALLLVAQPAMATNLWCTGEIRRIYVDKGASMYVLTTWHASYLKICNLSATWEGITSDLCKTWFAMLQGAYHAQTTTIIYYNAVPEASCADFPNYSGSPGPYYVMNRD